MQDSLFWRHLFACLSLTEVLFCFLFLFFFLETTKENSGHKLETEFTKKKKRRKVTQKLDVVREKKKGKKKQLERRRTMCVRGAPLSLSLFPTQSLLHTTEMTFT